jgi:hypothetical protein
MPHPSTILGERAADWEPVAYAIRVPRPPDGTPAWFWEAGLEAARQQLVRHAIAHNIAVDSIRRMDKAGSVIFYFAGVRLLHERQRRALQAAFDRERGRPSLLAWEAAERRSGVAQPLVLPEVRRGRPAPRRVALGVGS